MPPPEARDYAQPTRRRNGDRRRLLSGVSRTTSSTRIENAFQCEEIGGASYLGICWKFAGPDGTTPIMKALPARQDTPA